MCECQQYFQTFRAMRTIDVHKLDLFLEAELLQST